MTTQSSVNIPPDREVDGSVEGSLISVGERVPRAKSDVNSRLIYALMTYYIALLVGCVAVIALLTWKYGATILAPAPAYEPQNVTQMLENVTRMLASMAFLLSGAVVGSVLYQIRMLFRSYIKLADFDKRWLAKYISAPVEAAGLALAIASLIEGGAVVLGGQGFDFSHGKPFASFGIGALIGFGIREVVGWLGTVSRVVFPTDIPTPRSSKANQQAQDAVER